MISVNSFLFEGMSDKDLHNKLSDSIKKQDVASQYSDDRVYEIINELIPNDFYRKNNNYKSLRFVGVINKEIDEISFVVYCLPKYMNYYNNYELFQSQEEDEDTEIEKMICKFKDDVLKIIEMTKHDKDYEAASLFDEMTYNIDRRHVSKAELAKWIVNDYANNGLFFFKVKRDSFMRKGRTNWGKTVTKTLPIQMGKESVYVNPIHTFREREYDNEITAIHRHVVREAIKQIRAFDGALADSVVPPESDSMLYDSMDKSVMLSVIRKYFRNAFSDRDIALLRALEAWCSDTNYYESPYTGTVSFELVWEDVILGVFGHKKLQKKKGFGKPRYFLDDNPKPYDLDGDSIPDAMNFWVDDAKDEDKDNRCFLILDGKYYLGRISKSESKVFDLPQYKDIAKQIDYFESLTTIYGLKPENGVNAFVLPYWDLGISKDYIEKNTFAFPDELDCKGKTDYNIEVRFLGYAAKPDMDNELSRVIGDLTSVNLAENQHKEKTSESISRIRSERVYVLQIDPDSLYKCYINKNVNENEERACWLYKKLIESERSISV